MLVQGSVTFAGFRARKCHCFLAQPTTAELMCSGATGNNAWGHVIIKVNRRCFQVLEIVGVGLSFTKSIWDSILGT